MHSRVFVVMAVCQLVSLGFVSETMGYAGEKSPFAIEVVSFDAGTNPTFGYDDPQSVLGSPARYTGVFFEYPAVVSPFNPPFDPWDIYSIGAGGHVTVRLDRPIADHLHNLFGIDLLIFTNVSFEDSAYPAGVVGGIFGNDVYELHVSPDNLNWTQLKPNHSDVLMPTTGYLDTQAFQVRPGRIESVFTRPVDPTLSLSHFIGLSTPQVMQLYRGSGGGTGFDLAGSGLTEVSYVRISNPKGAPFSVEVDAIAAVLPRHPGDVNFDGVTNVDDLVELLGAWGSTQPGGTPADFNNDGLINVDDLVILLGGWS